MEKHYIIFLTFFISIHAADSATENFCRNKKYIDHPSAQYHFGNYLLSHIKFEENDTVIDIGCGNGKTTQKIAQKIPKGFVVGIDNDLEMIIQAQRYCKNTSNIEITFLDALKLKTDIPVNKVIATCSLSWIHDQKKVYELISESLTLGGVFFALISNAKDPLFLSHYIVMKKPKWEKYCKNYVPNFYPSSQEEIKASLITAKLKPVLIMNADLPTTKITKKDFIEKLNTNPGVKDVIPQKKYRSFLREVVKEYIEQTKTIDENNIEISCGLLLVIAEKV